MHPPLSSQRTIRIGIIMPPEYRFGREIILGAAKYCMLNGLSMLHMGSPPSDEAVDPRLYSVDGVISFMCTPPVIKKYKAWKIALVTTSSRLPPQGVPCVQADNELIGRVGAQHLISRGFRTLAFCGINGHEYSKLRRKGFIEAATDAAVECSWTDDVSIDLSDSPADSSMVKWLRTLKRPVGLMACNDIRSRHVAEGCRIAGLSVPDDVAITGVDNDEVICQGMDPMLSSVDPNAFRIGFEAAALLSRIITKKNCNHRTLIPPLGVVPRQSTFTISSRDPILSQALLLIHERSEEPLSVWDIAQEIGLSRRTLERKFRMHYGGSIASAIRRAHVERARQLLIDTDLSLEEIAEASGLKDLRQLRISFQRELGQSPSKVRNSFQKLS